MTLPKRELVCPTHSDRNSYRSITIEECHDPLVEIPESCFAFTTPHAYVALDAPYDSVSPWMLRKSVLDALLIAQAELHQRKPGWRLKLFDAYRPIRVQAFMVWREFQLQAEQAGCSLAPFPDLDALKMGNPALYEQLASRVFEFWGIPSHDPRTPPPHATGAAIDLTLEDATRHTVDMGCPIDETSERAYPDHYAESTAPEFQTYHQNRSLLNQIMSSAGFARHSNEWWHFSIGDQMWAWLQHKPIAIYGAADEIAGDDLTSERI